MASCSLMPLASIFFAMLKMHTQAVGCGKGRFLLPVSAIFPANCLVCAACAWRKPLHPTALPRSVHYMPSAAERVTSSLVSCGSTWTRILLDTRRFQKPPDAFANLAYFEKISNALIRHCKRDP